MEKVTPMGLNEIREKYLAFFERSFFILLFAVRTDTLSYRAEKA